MSRAVHHAFPDESVTHRAELVSRFADEFSDFSRPMDAFAQPRKRSHVFAFGGRHSVEPHAKELMIEPAPNNTNGKLSCATACRLRIRAAKSDLGKYC